jgi:hypothetical protein
MLRGVCISLIAPDEILNRRKTAPLSAKTNQKRPADTLEHENMVSTQMKRTKTELPTRTGLSSIAAPKHLESLQKALSAMEKAHQLAWMSMEARVGRIEQELAELKTKAHKHGGHISYAALMINILEKQVNSLLSDINIPPIGPIHPPENEDVWDDSWEASQAIDAFDEDVGEFSQLY